MEQREYVIYGLFIDDKCVYIGKTIRSFYKRYKEHKRNMELYAKGEYTGSQGELYDTLYNAKLAGHNVHAQVLLDLADMNTEAVMGHYELQCIELALITMYKDNLVNIEGKSKPYKFCW